MPWFRNTKRPAYSTLRANGREPMMQWPMRTTARNDVQNRADVPEGDKAGPENGHGRSGAPDRQGFDFILYGR
jgi:hypothetical protein